MYIDWITAFSNITHNNLTDIGHLVTTQIYNLPDLYMVIFFYGIFQCLILSLFSYNGWLVKNLSGTRKIICVLWCMPAYKYVSICLTSTRYIILYPWNICCVCAFSLNSFYKTLLISELDPSCDRESVWTTAV